MSVVEDLQEIGFQPSEGQNFLNSEAVIKALVEAGEVIALAGDTGELSSGTHLHFELWIDGNPIDPTEFISFE